MRAQALFDARHQLFSPKEGPTEENTMEKVISVLSAAKSSEELTAKLGTAR